MDITKRIESIVEQISKDLYEKEQSVKLVLLAVLAGESAFMLGEPGTAKSLVARRVAQAFANPTDAEQKQGVVKFFDYLMNRFSQPDEVFGPVSIGKLKNDIYERKTEGYLPKAQFAFLDEIWKANPAIQNALLTILNERTFRNGTTTEAVPLVGFVAASNELPAPNQGLEAIFDRFLVRIFEKPVSDSDNFRSMISGKALAKVNVEAPFDRDDLLAIRKAASEVKLSDECFNVIQNIRKQLTIKNEEKGREESERYVVSDRRWQKITNLMRVSAYCNGRKETDLLDASLIASCIWSSEKQEKEALGIVKKAISSCGIGNFSMNIDELKRDLEKFKESIASNFFVKEKNEKTKDISIKYDSYGRTRTISDTTCYICTYNGGKCLITKEKISIGYNTSYYWDKKNGKDIAFTPVDLEFNEKDGSYKDDDGNVYKIVLIDKENEALPKQAKQALARELDGELQTCVSRINDGRKLMSELKTEWEASHRNIFADNAFHDVIFKDLIHNELEFDRIEEAFKQEQARYQKLSN